MRGIVWLEEIVKDHQGEPLPIVKVSEDINNFSYTNPIGHPSSIRIARMVKEAFRLDQPLNKYILLVVASPSAIPLGLGMTIHSPLV